MYIARESSDGTIQFPKPKNPIHALFLLKEKSRRIIEEETESIECPLCVGRSCVECNDVFGGVLWDNVKGHRSYQQECSIPCKQAFFGGFFFGVWGIGFKTAAKNYMLFYSGLYEYLSIILEGLEDECDEEWGVGGMSYEEVQNY